MATHSRSAPLPPVWDTSRWCSRGIWGQASWLVGAGPWEGALVVLVTQTADRAFIVLITVSSATRCAWGKNFPAAHHLDLTVSLYALGNDQGKREHTITGEGTEKLWELCWTTDAGWFEPVAISPRER